MAVGVGTTYDVGLDSQGYIIKKQTYVKALQQPFVDQMVDHEPTVSDFSFWKFFLQSDWSGGFDEIQLVAPNVFYASSNIDIHYKNGEFRLFKTLSSDLATGVISTDITVPLQFNGKFYLLAGRYVYVSTDGTTFSEAKDLGSGKTGSDMTVHNGQLYVACGASGFYSFDGSTWSSISTAFTPDYLTTWWNGNTETLIGTDDNVVKSSVDDGANWTTVKTFSADETIYIKKPIVYLKKVFFFASKGASTSAPHTLYLYDGLNVLDFWETEHDVAVRPHVYLNRLWWVVIAKNYETVYSFDGSEIVPEFQINDTNHTVPVNWCNFDDKMWLSFKHTQASSNYVIAYDGEKWSKPLLITSTANEYYSMGVFKNNIYFCHNDGVVKNLATTYSASGTLDSSELDMNLMNIDKLGMDIIVNFDKLAANCSVRADYQLDNSGSWTQAGATFSTANGTRAIFPFAANTKFKKMQYRITLASSDGASTPVVKDVIIRYIPLADVRYKWGFDILAINDIRLLNSVKETKTGEQLIAELHNSKEKQQVLDFEDIDYAATAINDGDDITATDTTITVDSTTGFPAKGRLRIENEEILYTGTTSVTFTGCTRGARGTQAVAHANDVAVTNVYKVLIYDYDKQVPEINDSDGLESFIKVSLIEV